MAWNFTKQARLAGQWREVLTAGFLLSLVEEEWNIWERGAALGHLMSTSCLCLSSASVSSLCSACRRSPHPTFPRQDKRRITKQCVSKWGGWGGPKRPRPVSHTFVVLGLGESLIHGGPWRELGHTLPSGEMSKTDTHGGNVVAAEGYMEQDGGTQGREVVVR